MSIKIDAEINFWDLIDINDQTLFGIPIQQTWTALYMIEQLLREQNFTYVFELGTGNGALSAYFQRWPLLHYWGFDIINDENIFSKFIKQGCPPNKTHNRENPDIL